MHTHNKNRHGFIALTAVLVLMLSSIFYEAIVLKSAIDYADMENRKESRIQANLNAKSCLMIVELMIAKDYFLSGDVNVDKFGCMAHVDRDYVNKTAHIVSHTKFNSISSVKFEKNFSISL